MYRHDSDNMFLDGIGSETGMTCLFFVGFPGQVWMAPVLLTDKRHSLEKCCF